MRFLIPVILENMLTVATTLIYSAITGAVSKSSLASVGVGNQAMNLVSAFFALITSGCAVITAADVGKRDLLSASRTVEHTISVSLISSAAAAGLLLLASGFTMKLLMPGAEADFLAEGTLYYRTLLFSVPPMVLYNALNSVLRAKGDSRSAFIATVVSNTVLLLLVYILVSRRDMGVKGVALALIVSRCCAALTAFIAVLRSREGFFVKLSRVFAFDKKVLRRVLRVGTPVSMSSIAVQVGYVAINSLLVSLGTLEAGVANVLNAIQQFTCIVHFIASCTATTVVGQECGAGRFAAARKSALAILWISLTATLLLCLPAVSFPRFCTGLFSSDAETIDAAVSFIWLVIPYSLLGMAINALEPAVCASGDTRYAMKVTVSGVWLIRLPLSLLFCMVLGWGVRGVYAANIASFVYRSALHFVRVAGPHFAKNRI
ncbi:MAG: MATE family efflux transporter [Clostridiales bacterium]|nr:MATE family efflux transporter [Clostridiales bacterium]